MTGLYFHFPFCKSKCGYCAFNSRPAKDESELHTYTTALITEMDLHAERLRDADVETIYFGGGTPSLFTTADLCAVLNKTFALAGTVDASGEITIEANPETVDAESMKQLRQAGFNRLSLGAQSFDQAALDFLGRSHRPDQVDAAVFLARTAGFDNLGLDLIVGLPEPFTGLFQADLQQAMALDPEHLSVYLLSADEPSQLSKKVERNQVTLPDNDVQADVFLECHRRLDQAGYEHYEVSNFARSGFASRHNSGYWKGAHYLGFGAGAHSYFERQGRPVRMANQTDPDTYVRRLQRGLDPIDFVEAITPDMALREKLMLGLRAGEGIDPADFGSHAKTVDRQLAGFSENGWYRIDGTRYRPTPEGMLVADGVASAIWEEMEK